MIEISESNPWPLATLYLTVKNICKKNGCFFLKAYRVAGSSFRLRK